MILDVSLPITPDMVRWPGDPAVEAESSGEEVHVSRWTLGSHAGTHVDAPIHFSAGPTTVDQLDPEIFLGTCRVVVIPDEQPVIDAALLERYALQGVTRVLFHTRNSHYWQENPREFDREFVALDASAARYLLQCGVKLIGVDGLSVEAFTGNGTVHRLLLTAGVVLLEGLSLAKAAAGDYYLFCAPLKLLGSDGAPARVFLLDGPPDVR